MTLAAGSKLGPYEILSAVGADGTGEVHKERGTRLDRTVAIKVLLSHLSDHPDVKRRFEQIGMVREARQVYSACTQQWQGKRV